MKVAKPQSLPPAFYTKHRRREERYGDGTRGAVAAGAAVGRIADEVEIKWGWASGGKVRNVKKKKKTRNVKKKKKQKCEEKKKTEM